MTGRRTAIVMLLLVFALCLSAGAGAQVIDPRRPAKLPYPEAQPQNQPDPAQAKPQANAFDPANEPWTGTWKVYSNELEGFIVLKQTGLKVVSTEESDYVIDATVDGISIRGKWGEKRSWRPLAKFTATLINNGQFFRAVAEDFNKQVFMCRKLQ